MLRKNWPYASMLLGAILFATAMMAGCAYCNKVENVNTAGCKSLRALEACGPKTMVIAAQCLADLGDYIKLLEDVAASAPEEYQCVATALHDQATHKWSTASPKLIAFESKDRELRGKIKLAAPPRSKL